MENINDAIIVAKKKKLRRGEPMPHPPGNEKEADLGWLEKNKNK